MSISKTRIVNGAFQDAEGNALALGSLLMKLSADEQAPANGQLVSGIEIIVPLDSSGNVSGTVLVWANNDIQPLNSFYIVRAFNANGQLVWGPQYQQVFSPGPFDLNTWIPNNTSISLTNLGVTNLNGETGPITLVAGTGVTITPAGQNITIAATATAGVTSLNAETGAVVLVAGSNVTITPVGQNITIAAANPGTGTVTNTAGALTANALVVGNGGNDEKVLASLGTTTTVLHGNASGLPTFATVVEADITLANNTTNNVSITKHGFAPIAPNDATKFLDGTGAYSTPSGSAVTIQTNTVNNASQTTLNLVAGTNITLTNTSGGNVTIDASGSSGRANPVPAAGSFTLVGQGPSAFTFYQRATGNAINMTFPSAGGLGVGLMVLTPPSPPYSLAIQFRIIPATSRANSAASGMFFRNSVGAQFIGLEDLTQGGSSLLEVRRFTNTFTSSTVPFTEVNSEATQATDWCYQYGWGRIRNDGTNLFFDVAYDFFGENYIQLYTETIAAFVGTVDQYGFGSFNDGTGQSLKIIVNQWVTTNSAAL